MSTAEQSDDNRSKRDVQEDSSQQAPDTGTRDTETYTPSTISSIKEMEEKNRSGATQWTQPMSLVGADTTGDARTGSPKRNDEGAPDHSSKPKPFDEQKARDAIKLFEQGNASDRQAAQRDLVKMGPDVLPQLEQLKNTTESFDTYSRAKLSISAIKAGMPGQAEMSKFDDSYDQQKATKLIDQLGSESPLERARAQDQLYKMGPRAISDLNTTGARSDDAETRVASGRLARDIASRAEKEKFAPYTDIANDVQELSALAGITFAPDASRPNKGVTRSIDAPKAVPNEEQRARFEKLIAAGDKLAGDKRLAGLVLETAQKQPEKLAALTTAGHASTIREVYARSLSASQDPKDKEKATALLKDQLAKHPDAAQDWILSDTAARVGAVNDKTFKDAFEKAGGDMKSLEFKTRRYTLGGKGENLREDRANQAISLLGKGSPAGSDKSIRFSFSG